MLRYLAEWLVQYHSAFNVFSYLTLRSILAALTAFPRWRAGRSTDTFLS